MRDELNATLDGIKTVAGKIEEQRQLCLQLVQGQAQDKEEGTRTATSLATLDGLVKETFTKMQGELHRLSQGVAEAQAKASDAVTAVNTKARQRENDVRVIVEMARVTR